MSGTTSRAPARRRLVTSVTFALTLIAAAVFAAVPPDPAQAGVLPKTVVSLTFDDANANQKAAVSILDKYKVDGTFYVPSGYVGEPGYLTWADLTAMKAAGHEIGGHTISHPDLTTLSGDELKRQVCDDRAALSARGFAVRSFAYPFASLDAAAKAAVSACGYNSGRGLGDLRSVSPESRNLPVAERIPPADPFETKALEQVETSWTLNDLKAAVTRAEPRGGWVQFTFHNVCASACEINVTPSTLDAFVSWLTKRNNVVQSTVVRTVGDTVGGAVKPVVNGPVAKPAGPGVNAVKNPGAETLDADGTPACWMKGGYGTNTATLDVTSPGRTGSRAARVAVSGYADGDAKWLQRFDLGDCSPTVAAGRTYSLRSWYTATGPTQFAVYLRDAGGAWRYWTSSPWFAASSTFAQAVWETPAIPAGMTGMSFGLNVFGNGSLVTDDVSAYDSVGAPGPSAAAVTAPALKQAPKVGVQVEPQPAAAPSPRG